MKLEDGPPSDPDTIVTNAFIDIEGVKRGIKNTLGQQATFAIALQKAGVDLQEAQNQVEAALRSAHQEFAKTFDLWQIYDFKIGFIGPVTKPTYIEFYFEGLLMSGSLATFRVMLEIETGAWYTDYKAHFKEFSRGQIPDREA